MKLVFLMLCLFMMSNVESYELKCARFHYPQDYYSNTYDGEFKPYYECSFDHASLNNENEPVFIDTQLNQKPNDEVTLVYYKYDTTVKFIPNSLFTTFINLEYLVMSHRNKFEIMKAESLKNARKLKNFHVIGSDVKVLGANVFAEAANLEHINFERNKIESIHKLAFNGLQNLQGVYLIGNKITKLHPFTFSSITKLNILELSENTCINQKFVEANKNGLEVETAIQKSCIFELSPAEAINQSNTNLTKTIKNLEYKQEMDNKLILELNEKLINITVPALSEVNQDNLEAKIMKAMEAMFASYQETLKNVYINACKVELEAIDQKCSNIFQAIVSRINDQKDVNQNDLQNLQTSFDQRLKKLEE